MSFHYDLPYSDRVLLLTRWMDGQQRPKHEQNTNGMLFGLRNMILQSCRKRCSLGLCTSIQQSAMHSQNEESFECVPFPWSRAVSSMSAVTWTSCGVVNIHLQWRLCCETVCAVIALSSCRFPSMTLVTILSPSSPEFASSG